MDLIDLSRKALRKPFHHTNFFVLFVTVFIVLIIGLTILSAAGLVMGGSKKFDKCSQSKKVSGKLSQNKQAVYQLEYQGGTECILTAIFDWKNPEDVTSIWVYNPEGDIEVIEPGKNQTSATFAKNSPLSQGRYRFVLKSEKSSELKYSGNISIR